MPRRQRQRSTEVAFDVNLEYGTSISALTVDAQRWRSGHPSLLPIRDTIQREGIRV